MVENLTYDVAKNIYKEVFNINVVYIPNEQLYIITDETSEIVVNTTEVVIEQLQNEIQLIYKYELQDYIKLYEDFITKLTCK